MIDPQTETLITLTEAAKREPGRPNVTTIWRWRNRGVRGVKLETILSGGRRFTSVEAIARFHDRVNAAANGESPRIENSRQRQSAIAHAEAAALGNNTLNSPLENKH